MLKTHYKLFLYCLHNAKDPKSKFYYLSETHLKGRYSIGNAGKIASTTMLTLFESRYTLKGRYNIGNVGKTASMSMLTLFESRYTLKEGTTLVMLVKLLL